VASFAEPVTIGSVLGLVAGELIGLVGSVVVLVRLGLAPLPDAEAGISPSDRAPVESALT
jgi:Na+:H+ antiporter, NhaA family